MSRITLTTILAIFLLGSFFMPFFYWNSFEMNGFNFILSDRIPPYKYLLLLIPFIVLFYLFGVLSEENYPFIRKLLSWMPLTIILIVFLLAFINGNSDNTVFESGSIFSNTGVGFLFASGLSLVLALVKPKSRYHF